MIWYSSVSSFVMYCLMYFTLLEQMQKGAMKLVDSLQTGLMRGLRELGFCGKGS